MNRENASPADSESTTLASVKTTDTTSNATAAQEEPAADTPEKPQEPEVKGYPDIAPLYVSRLLPVFTTVYQGTMLSSVRYV